jgi:hypothetical protein
MNQLKLLMTVWQYCRQQGKLHFHENGNGNGNGICTQKVTVETGKVCSFSRIHRAI